MFARSPGLRACTLALTLIATVLPAHPQAAASEIELESWRAASRLDTPDAYRAYLAQYPSGAFARFAQLALAKLGGPAPAAAAPAPSALPAAMAELDTNIVELRVGERLNGPGVISVGSFGSRRHVLLPRGEWVVLAGFDHRSGNQVPVPMVTLAFGQFAGEQLRSVLAVSFNRRNVAPASGGGPSIVAMGMLPRWTAAEQCEAPSPALLHHAVAATRTLKHCDAMRRLAEGEDAWAGSGELRSGVDAALQLLKAQPLRPALRSEVHLTDNRYGYMGYLRLDANLPATERATWLKAYGPLAAGAYERELELDELRPGQPAPASAQQLALPY
jgi:hypothetical protein